MDVLDLAKIIDGIIGKAQVGMRSSVSRQAILDATLADLEQAVKDARSNPQRGVNMVAISGDGSTTIQVGGRIYGHQ